MNCYRHQENSAIGICKSCMKGLCPTCAVEVGNSLACKNSCEENVRKINESQINQSIIQPFAKVAQKAGPIFLTVYGLYLVVYWSGLVKQYADYGMVGLGVICLVGGIVLGYKGFFSK